MCHFHSLFKKSSLRNWVTGILFFIPFVMIFSAAHYFDKTYTSEDNGYYHLGHQDIQYYEEAKTHTDVNSILQEKFTALPGESEDPNFGFNTHNIWLKFETDPQKLSIHSEVLQINNPMLNEVELYQLSNHGPVLMVRTGDLYPFYSRPIEHRTFRIPIQIDRNSSTKYLLKVNSGGEQLLAPLSIWSKQAMSEKDYQDNLMRGCYFGLITFVLLFTLFLFLRLREKSSLYYVQYNMNLLLLQFALSGYSFQYLWPQNIYLANIATPFFASISILALLRFSQHFLELNVYFPKINTIFQYVSYIVILIAGTSLIWTQTTFYLSVVSINVMALLLNVAIIPVALAVLRKGFKPAKFFLIGFITLVFTVFGFISTNLGLIRNEFYADYGLLIGSAVEVVLLSFAVVDRFRSFKEQALESLRELNKLEREQNEVLEITVQQRTEEILEQKSILEFQKEEILSSIRYAERIQKNLLPSENEMKSAFPESFVFYKPKDIVSGDFYWIGKTKLNGVNGPAHDVTLLAAADCTGHGVPGAMVSVMGCNLLRETLHQFPEADPDKMLFEIDQRLKQTMTTHEGAHSSDGMDIVLCAYQHDTQELRVSGANNDVIVWNGSELITLKGTSRAIGARNEHQLADFSLQKIKLTKGNSIYVFTDGFADQFGGEKNKKLKISGFKNLLMEIVSRPMAEQKKTIENFFEAWKGCNDQIDDVCVIGLRI